MNFLAVGDRWSFIASRSSRSAECIRFICSFNLSLRLNCFPQLAHRNSRWSECLLNKEYNLRLVTEFSNLPNSQFKEYIKDGSKNSDQVLHLYKTTCKIVVSYVLIFTFLCNTKQEWSFYTVCQPALPQFNLLLISLWMQFWFVSIIPKYLSFILFSKHMFRGIFISWFCAAVWSQDIKYILNLLSVTLNQLFHSI
jgi:hypothetical protein